MSEQPHRTDHLHKLLTLLIGVVAAILTVTVPEVRGFLGLDRPEHEETRDARSSSPAQSPGDSMAGWGSAVDVAAPAVVSAETLSQVVNEPRYDTVVSVTQTVDTTWAQP
ncbi:hypothetical protein [Longimicrobium sp.]|uniref:hypothetical protein n=1 Tax=Longimicrobium sp. TaxID=2029185 RepID=UPI002CC878FE|nr:hypothetical protein [Longimicrobium sp.]HSU15614.1 hypothetical protein [Longimicrobium sp.]